MNKNETIFAFDLDGTVTKQEILPILAKELDLYEELSLLTKLTLDGTMDFKQSFRLRVEILKNISISRIQEVISDIPLDENLEHFIRENRTRSMIVTGNLDVWIEPIIQKLGCKTYSSIGIVENKRLLGIKEILLKNKAIIDVKQNFNRVIAIGESYNDIPMFTESDIGIAYGGIHEPINELVQVSDYVVFDGGSLCNLLEML